MNTYFLRAFAFLTLILLLSISTGCADGRAQVTGTVKYKGEPVKAGTITFLKDGAPAGGAPIIDGTYDIPAKPGLAAGSYVVTISAPDPKYAPKVSDQPGESGPAPKEMLPAEYNKDTKLKAEVKAGQKNVIDFVDLK